MRPYGGPQKQAVKLRGTGLDQEITLSAPCTGNAWRPKPHAKASDNPDSSTRSFKNPAGFSPLSLSGSVHSENTVLYRYYVLDTKAFFW